MKFITPEVVPVRGWVNPDDPLHPDYDEVIKDFKDKKSEKRD